MMTVDAPPALLDVRHALLATGLHIDECLDQAGVCPAWDILCSNVKKSATKDP